MQKGFVSIPIIIIVILGTLVIGGGGYTAYKINQIEKDNAELAAQLQNKNFDDTNSGTVDFLIEEDLVIVDNEISYEVDILDIPDVTERHVEVEKLPDTAPVAPAIVTQSQNQVIDNYNYVLVQSRENEIIYGNKILTSINEIKSHILSEKATFVAIKNQTTSNLKGLGYDDIFISNLGIIKLYDEYIKYLDNTRNLFDAEEESVANFIGIFRQLVLEAKNSNVSYNEANQYILSGGETSYLRNVASRVDESFQRFEAFQKEVHLNLRQFADSYTTPTYTPPPALNIPRTATTLCTSNLGGFTCNSISF